LRRRFSSAVSAAIQQTSPNVAAATDVDETDAPSEPFDADAAYRAAAITQLRVDRDFQHEIKSKGMWLWRLAQRLRHYGPGDEILGEDEGFNWGLSVVEQAMSEMFGRDGFKREYRDYKGRSLVWVTATPTEVPSGETPSEQEPPD